MRNLLPHEKPISSFPTSRIQEQAHLSRACQRVLYGIRTEARGQRTISCPHLGCPTMHNTEQDCWWHLQDAHSYPPRKAVASPGSKSRDVDTGERCSKRRRKRCKDDREREASDAEPASKRRRLRRTPGPSVDGYASSKTEDAEVADCTWSMPSFSGPASGTEAGTASSGVSTPLSSDFDGQVQDESSSAVLTASPFTESTANEISQINQICPRI
jgi:hypothetical protein